MLFLYIALLPVVALAQIRRIIGGYDTTINEFPHMISLRYNGTHDCGGSIYKSNIIITAAHCAGSSSELYSVGAGSSYWAHPQQVANVKKIIIHEKWNSTTIDNDIAILVLDRHLHFNEAVQPIRLANQIPAPGAKVTAIGWGLTSENGNISDRLKKVGLELVGSSQCQEIYSKHRLTDRMLCAGLQAGGKGICNTDSGGPLVNALNGQLLGIVSWSEGCARSKYPGVYASVPNLHDWIVKTVEENVAL